MKKLYVGCGPIPTQRKDYFDSFNALDMTETWYEPLGEGALRDIRSQAGKDAAFIVHIWRWLAIDPLDERGTPPNGLRLSDVGMLKATDANKSLWAPVVEQAKAAKAAGVLIRTPASLTPSDSGIAAIREFAASVVGKDGPRIYWEPRGFWELDEIRPLCDDLGWVPVIDPWQDFEMPDAVGDDAFYVLHQPRGRRQFDREDCEEMLDLFEEHEGDVICSFRGASRRKNAMRFAAAARARGLLEI